MNEEIGKATNVLNHMLGMQVVECSIDNDTFLLKLNRAQFAFFCEYEIDPKSALLSDLIGAKLERIDDSAKSMSFGFNSGVSVKFSWDKCTNVEAFAGSIDTEDGQELWVSEEA